MAGQSKAEALADGWNQQFGAAASASSYIATSLAMTSLTKYAASSWRFPGSSLLLLIECWATVAALVATAPRGRPYKPFNRVILRHCSLVTVAKALNMYLSFIAMKRTSLPVYNVLKRLQPVYALVQDWAIRGTTASGMEQAGVAMLCIGTAITGLGDLDFDVLGYSVALVAAACQSLYLVLARNAQDHVKELTHIDLLFYTALYNTALFAPLSMIEAPEVWRFMGGRGEKTRFAQFLVPYVVMGALLNYATFWCTSANSPLATAVAGTAKGVLSTAYGAAVLGARLTPLGWLGLVGSTLGGFVYSVAQASRKRKAK